VASLSTFQWTPEGLKALHPWPGGASPLPPLPKKWSTPSKRFQRARLEGRRAAVWALPENATVDEAAAEGRRRILERWALTPRKAAAAPLSTLDQGLLFAMATGRRNGGRSMVDTAATAVIVRDAVGSGGYAHAVASFCAMWSWKDVEKQPADMPRLPVPPAMTLTETLEHPHIEAWDDFTFWDRSDYAL